MDTEKLIAHSRSRFDHETAKRTLKEKYQAKMIFAYAGGLWKAGPELLCILVSIPDNNSAVLLDLYENPIEINTQELRSLVIERWQEQMNAWLIEYQQIQTQR